MKGLKATKVLKTNKYANRIGMEDDKSDFLCQVETQAIAAHLAEQFNKLKPDFAKPIKFLEVKLVEVGEKFRTEKDETIVS